MTHLIFDPLEAEREDRWALRLLFSAGFVPD